MLDNLDASTVAHNPGGKRIGAAAGVSHAYRQESCKGNLRVDHLCQCRLTTLGISCMRTLTSGKNRSVDSDSTVRSYQLLPPRMSVFMPLIGAVPYARLVRLRACGSPKRG